MRFNWTTVFFLFGVFLPNREFFTHLETHHTGEVLQILTYVWHLWPLRSECSLAYHAYCDTGHPFIMVISEDPWHSHLMPSVWQWSGHYLFKRLRSVASGIRTPNNWTTENTWKSLCGSLHVCLFLFHSLIRKTFILLSYNVIVVYFRL